MSKQHTYTESNGLALEYIGRGGSILKQRGYKVHAAPRNFTHAFQGIKEIYAKRQKARQHT